MTSAEEHVENPSAESLSAVTERAPEPESAAAAAAAAAAERWPGWPGYCVFRMIVSVAKVGSIIGRKGELIKKMCDETHARVRVLDGPLGNPDRIVLITGKEDPESPLSSAMDAAVRVFKRVCELSETDGTVSGAAFCSIRLLVASSQATSLIGKQGSSIKSMQESSGASIRILNNVEVPFYATQDEKIAELQGEAAKVLKALEAVLQHLRKFLVDQTVLPLFEKPYNTPVMQERLVDSWAEKSLLHSASQPIITADYPPFDKREPLFFERETRLEQRIPSSVYSHDPELSVLRSSGLGRATGPIVTQVAQTMQIPITYAEDIIGIRGANIAYIRRSSGAILTVQESRGLADEITIEIKGTSLQVETAQRLIREFVSNHKEPVTSSYGQEDADLRIYSSSSMPTQPYDGGYGSSGLGGYGIYRY